MRHARHRRPPRGERPRTAGVRGADRARSAAAGEEAPTAPSLGLDGYSIRAIISDMRYSQLGQRLRIWVEAESDLRGAGGRDPPPRGACRRRRAARASRPDPRLHRARSSPVSASSSSSPPTGMRSRVRRAWPRCSRRSPPPTAPVTCSGSPAPTDRPSARRSCSWARSRSARASSSSARCTTCRRTTRSPSSSGRRPRCPRPRVVRSRWIAALGLVDASGRG